MRAIFISYRRDDAEGEAGRLFDDLVGVFGEHSVFMDVAAIEAGRDFRKAIDESVATCGVLLAILGKDWVDAKDEAGQRRLDSASDFVRLETASALKRDIPVIPVLVHGARMPRAEQLPDDLKELAYRNGVELTHARWGSDVQLLIKALRPHVEEPRDGSAGQTQPVAGAAAVRRAPAPVARAVPEVVPSPLPPRKSLAPIFAVVAAVVAAGAVGAYMLMPTQVTVPDLSGSSLPNATAKLLALKLAVGQTALKDDATKDPNIILSQSPPANTRVKSGTTVDLVISQQPQAAMVEIPALVGKSLDTALQSLAALQLTVGNIARVPKADVGADTVLEEIPGPGEKIRSGSKVALLVSQVPDAGTAAPVGPDNAAEEKAQKAKWAAAQRAAAAKEAAAKAAADKAAADKATADKAAADKVAAEKAAAERNAADKAAADKAAAERAAAEKAAAEQKAFAEKAAVDRAAAERAAAEQKALAEKAAADRAAAEKAAADQRASANKKSSFGAALGAGLGAAMGGAASGNTSGSTSARQKYPNFAGTWKMVEHISNGAPQQIIGTPTMTIIQNQGVIIIRNREMSITNEGKVVLVSTKDNVVHRDILGLIGSNLVHEIITEYPNGHKDVNVWKYQRIAP